MIKTNKKIRVIMPHDIDEFHDLITNKSKLEGIVFAHSSKRCSFEFLDEISFEVYLIENEYNLEYLFDRFNSEGSYIGLLAQMKYNIDKINYRDKDRIFK